MVAQHQPVGIGDPADDREIKLPFFEDRLCCRLASRLEDHQHAFLALAQHDFIRRHGVLAHRHLVHMELDPDVALRRHLDRRRRQTGGPHVLDRDNGLRRHQFETGFDQELFGKRIADLHGGAFFVCIIVEFGRCHGRAVDAIAAGF